MNWLISADENKFDVAHCFAHHAEIDWHQGRIKYSVNDVVYIYSTAPLQRIRFKTRVVAVNKKRSECRDDGEYWLDTGEERKYLDSELFFNLKLIDEADSDRLSLPYLKENGLKSAPQGPRKVTKDLELYVSSVFARANDEDFPETIVSGSGIYEGMKKLVAVNKYERSSIARARCIKVHGCLCKVCGFSFEEKYGEIGRGFIHVHHITPIHSIGESYEIDYVKDLIPVCPNCHAMLHRQINGMYCSVTELAEILK